MNYYFGRNESPPDDRDYKLENFMPKFKIQMIEEKCWEFPLDALNQKATGHCVGFSMADFGINKPTVTEYTNDDGHKFYYCCKELEGEPLQENGAYVRSAAKVLQKIGKIKNYAFTNNIESIKYWLLAKGPLIVGTIFTEGMTKPDENNIIKPTGKNVGGHAYIISEYRKDGYFGIQNSWGSGWGDNGKAYISVADFEKIIKDGGEIMTAVEIDGTPIIEIKIGIFEKIKAFFIRIIKKIFTK